MESFAAIVLAGGAGRRMGGARKPELPVSGRRMLDRVLDAVAGATQVIVVGPADLAVPESVRLTREHPPGGGPAAATAAGLALVDPETPMVALVAADLPLLTPAAVDTLRRALAAGPRAQAAAGPGGGGQAAGPGGGSPAGPGGGTLVARPGGGTLVARPDGALYLDAVGQRQTLCGVWRASALAGALGRLAAERGDVSGAPLRAALAGLNIIDVPWPGSDAPPWFDCDTDADLRQAEEWTR